VFPSGVPALYSNLARQCWETDVHLRPSFAQIRKELQVRLACVAVLASQGGRALLPCLVFWSLMHALKVVGPVRAADCMHMCRRASAWSAEHVWEAC
jgi:hypothetical protein